MNELIEKLTDEQLEKFMIAMHYLSSWGYDPLVDPKLTEDQRSELKTTLNDLFSTDDCADDLLIEADDYRNQLDRDYENNDLIGLSIEIDSPLTRAFDQVRFENSKNV